MPKIKYCPFCGRPGIIEVKVCQGESETKVFCEYCGASINRYHPTAELAIQEWNDRTNFMNLNDLYDQIYEWCGYDPAAVGNTLKELTDKFYKEIEDEDEEIFKRRYNATK